MLSKHALLLGKPFGKKNQHDEDKIPLNGFGIHEGRMLVIHGTELVLGDCINISSKLSEDLGANESINLSDDVYEHIKDREEIKSHSFEKKSSDISGLNIVYYSLSK